ncbi:type II toxin-antitoxin system TacA family antitoxin [Aquirufa sp. TARAVU-A1A]
MSTASTLEKEARSTRFDARLSERQKILFSEAARIEGFKSLSEFVIQTTQTAAIQIIERNQQILASENDQKIFFEAFVSPPEPNQTLLEGAKRYTSKMSE